MEMKKVVGAVVAISVGLILTGSLLAEAVNTYTGTTTAALYDYKEIIGALVTVTVVAIMMVAVRLITSSRD